MPPPPFIHRALAAVVCLLGLCSALGLALGLNAHDLTYNLHSDALYPYAFCLEVLHGTVPLSGWTMSSAPYFFPDHAVLTGLFAACGDLAPGLYFVGVYLVLGVLAGLCAGNVAGRGAAWVGGLLFAHGLLAARALPGHEEYLFWIGIPGCHGGALLLGLAYFWLLGMAVRRERTGQLTLPLFGVLLAGLGSDTLFLFQFLVPAGCALLVGQRRHPAFARLLRGQIVAGAAALLTSLGLKGLGVHLGYFDYGRVFRYALTPARQWQSAVRFGADLTGKGLPTAWGFLALAVAAGAWIAWRSRQGPDAGSAGDRRGAVLDFYQAACVASLLVMLPLPILSCHWKNASCARYLLNWMVLPAFGLTLAGALKWREIAARGDGRARAAVLACAGAGFLVCAVVSTRGIGVASLRLPYPADVAALDAFVRQRGLHYGLGQYWNTCYADVLSRDSLKLRQVRANGDPYFWNSNTSDYFARDARGKFVWPTYDYAVANTLDEAVLLRLFGEPRTREQVGRFTVLTYSEESQRRIRAVLEPAVERRLAGPRLEYLRRHGLE